MVSVQQITPHVKVYFSSRGILSTVIFVIFLTMDVDV